MVPRGLQPKDRVLFKNSRVTRMLAARVTRVTNTHLVVRELKSGRERVFAFADPHAHVQRVEDR